MRALTRIFIALLLGIFITGAMLAQATDQNATPDVAPGPHKMMGHDRQRGFDRLAQQLNLNDQQKTQVQSFMQNQHQQAQAIRQDTSLTPEQKRDKLQQLRQSNHQQMMGILTPEQQQKFQQLRSEHKGRGRGTMGGGMGPMSRLNLTPDQKSKLDPIFQASRQQFEAVRNDTSLTPEQKQAKIREIQQGTQSQVNSILTPEQQQQWRQMKMHRGRGPKPGPPPAPPSGS
jgi:Spy/CpxP family protein refolding chaperone